MENERIIIIHQSNQGLAAARNNGINIAKGKYIIPLDSDNKLHENYLTKAIKILDKSPPIDVVYGNPIFFGEPEYIKRIIGEFNLEKMIASNYIDACAVFRKETWTRVNGYDGKMPMGHEDWEFWINVYLNGANFFYLNEPCYYYRVITNSMSKTISNPAEKLNEKYIHQKHCSAIIQKLTFESILKQNRLDSANKNKVKTIVKLLLGYRL